MTTADARTGWDLVAAIQAGDTDAFGQLWGMYHLRVIGYVRTLLPVYEHDLVDDIASDTFLRAYRAIDRVEDQGRDVIAWLMRIARNLVLDHRKRSHSRLSTPVGDRYFWEVAAATPGPDAVVPEQRAAEDAAERLEHMVSTLSPGQQAAIRHRFYGERSNAETADLMGCTVGAAKAAQCRAVKTLARKARPARTVAEFITNDGPAR